MCVCVRVSACVCVCSCTTNVTALSEGMSVCMWGQAHLSVDECDSILVSRQDANRAAVCLREGPPVPHLAYAIIPSRENDLRTLICKCDCVSIILMCIYLCMQEGRKERGVYRKGGSRGDTEEE